MVAPAKDVCFTRRRRWRRGGKTAFRRTYDIAFPPVLAVKLTGAPRPGVGPQDVALALIAATFQNDFNKNKIL